MTADEAGAAGDQHAFHGALLYRLWKKARSSFVLMPRASVPSATSSGVTVQTCADRKGWAARKLISPAPPPRDALFRYPSQAGLRPCVTSRNVPTSEKPPERVASPSRVCRT